MKADRRGIERARALLDDRWAASAKAAYAGTEGQPAASERHATMAAHEPDYDATAAALDREAEARSAPPLSLDDPFNSMLSGKILMAVHEVKAPADERYSAFRGHPHAHGVL
jgi:hypothetical protein